MENPYCIQGPASISFSGGRTSAFMLRQIIDAHGGTLPSDVVVCFANTGLEHAETYKFIHEIETRWSVPINWLEYRHEPGRHYFVKVQYGTHSTKGEPFEHVISARNFLPNPMTRFCTSEMKIRTMRRFVVSLGWDEYTSVVGLRADEPWRVAKIKGDHANESVVCPMHAAGHTLGDVEAFWSVQDFRLGIPQRMGNCVGCFLKARHKLEMIAREEPDQLAWWARQEGRFMDSDGRPSVWRIDRPGYRVILKQVQQQGKMFDDTEEDSIPCMCHE